MSLFRTIFSGFCMGIADLVPGISGGTIALILGFYETLIQSIKGITKVSSWKFLLPLGGGVLLAFLTCSHIFRFLLNDPIYRIYLFACFFGFIVASTFQCAKKVETWNRSMIVIAGVGGVIAFYFSGASAGGELQIPVFFCGVAAICAMLLPGISGSTVLLMLGAYPLFINAVANITDPDSLYFLLEASLGAIVGALLFSRVISWLLSSYYEGTFVFLTGLMLGALRAVWPFQEMPSILSFQFIGALTFALLGFVLVVGLQRIPGIYFQRT